MSTRTWLAVPLAAALFVPFLPRVLVIACCPAPPSGQPVVNADQTVVIIWDAATRTQHFIRQASFKSEADDFGFLVPTPSQPELNESGNEAFGFLSKLTEPATQQVPRPSRGVSCGCSDEGRVPSAALRVQVLEEKLVAGFNAVVLRADSADLLVKWLEGNGYAFSPEVQAWAKPYVEAGWVITALKVAKPQARAETGDGSGPETQPATQPDDIDVAAPALRMTFKTDRPLFPYREPDSRTSAEALDAKRRLLRIYFFAEARYQGELTQDVPWTGKLAWADKLNAADRSRALELLNLPENTGPAELWLTEFEDPWPYRVAPADVYFSRAADQTAVKRPPIVEYVSAPPSPDILVEGLMAVALVSPLVRRMRRGRGA